MKKRILIICILIIGLVSTIGAKGIEPIFKSVRMYNDFWAGPTPTYLEGGVAYNFGPVINELDTRVFGVIGGGYYQREQYRKPLNNSYNPSDSPNNVVYDLATVLWEVGYSQEFLKRSDVDSAMLTATVAYQGRWEKAFDPYNKSKHPDVLASLGDNYKDVSGSDHQFLSNAILADLEFDLQHKEGPIHDGIWAKLETVSSPSFLNGALSGKAGFGSLRLDFVGSYTPYVLSSESGLNLFSINIVDRVSTQYVFGKYVPSYFVESYAMGSKVRGYKNYSYDARLSLVNNFEVRLNGPDMGVKNLFPRLILFTDLGFGLKTNYVGSVGTALTINVLNYLDIGYEVAYVFGAEKYTNHSSRLYHGLVVGLQF